MTPFDLPALAQQIADALEAPWKISQARRFDPNDPANIPERSDGLYLQGEGVERLRLTAVSGSNMQRLAVSGIYPATERGGFIALPRGTQSPDITVAISRGAASIAREIDRRFLPEYRKALAAVQEAKHDTEAFARAREENVRALAQIFNSEPSARNLETGILRISLPGTGSLELEAFDQSVHLTLRLIPVEKALRVARILAERDPEASGPEA